jgi:porin
MGLLDLNSEFDAPVTSSFFIGPPFGIGTDLAQTGQNGPAVFPVTALGVRLAGELPGSVQWRAAAFDGVPGSVEHDRFASVDVSRNEGALLIGELEFAPAGFNKLAVGAWSYTAAFESIDAAAGGDTVPRKGNHGAYAMVDLPLGAFSGTRVDATLRVGTAAGRFNAVSRYAGLAFVASHLSDSRPEDAVGLAIAHGRTGSAFRRALAFDGAEPLASETQVEFTWRTPVRPWLALVPGVQWVANPGADRAVRDAWIVGLRLELGFDRNWPLLVQQADPVRAPSLVVSNP